MSGPALARAILAQAAAELTLTLRRGESVLVTMIIPVVLLIFFGSVHILPVAIRSIDFLLPGTLALAVISTGLVSLGIATGFERQYGVLKQFGATPFPRGGLIAGKLLAAATLEAVQVALLVGMAVVLFGWRPHGSAPLALLALALGAVAFAGLGLLMAGALRAEATLAAANGLFLLFLLLGGLYVPLGDLPAWLAPIARALPAAALAETLRATLSAGAHIPGWEAAILVAWAVVAPLAAARAFRWE